MPNRITEQLIRKKSEHNDGLLGDLEEVSLHQCELGRLEVIGTLCRKLRILYLQNNVIPRIENCEHLKDLRYLNLALNNVTKIEGLQNCEFLNKLDLTVNFVDLDTFEESVTHLASLHALRELFLMGNPCAEWDQHRAYVVARCPQITTIDGKEVTRSERIQAAQALPVMIEDLKVLAVKVRDEKAAKRLGGEGESKGAADDDDRCDWSPEVRLEIAEEQAEQKRKDEEGKKHMQVPERDYEKEHEEKVAKAKEEEEQAGPSKIRQCNEGRYEFRLEDEDGQGNVVLHLPLPKFLDNSLLSVDVHPTYITVVIKGKILRLVLPEEVKPDAGSAKRSRTTGDLVITMPKENPNLRLAKRLKERLREEEEENKKAAEERKAARRAKLPQKVGDAMLAAAGAPVSNAVDVGSIVKGRGAGAGADMKARATTRSAALQAAHDASTAAAAEVAAEAAVEAAAGDLDSGVRAEGGAGGDDDDDDWEDDADVPPLE